MKTVAVAAAGLLFLISTAAFADSADEEGVLFRELSPEAQQFFLRSAEIRAGYPEENAYKHFQRDRDDNGKVDVMDRDGYLHLSTGDNGYTANPAVYGKAPAGSPRVFYRYVRDCKTKTTIERQRIATDGTYMNYIGGDRYQQQCVEDGTPDQYYVESLTKLE